MNVNATLEAGTQLAKRCQPGMSALNHPPMPSEPVIALNAPAGDTVPDTAALEVSAAPGEVVALVCVQLAGPAAQPAWLATNSREGIDQFLEDHRIMPVGTGDAKHQRDALAVRNQGDRTKVGANKI